ncbi:MAG: ribosomal protein S18-alanine N-acetyltransferase [Schwartzia sp.]|nr:ribosomal protein S18-alanine N-acetyltransferase [Schwartzia sp. (in: firmicutes)]
MTPEDADAVEAVEKASFAVPWSRKSFWEEAANERTFYLLALDDEKVIGYAGTWILDDEAQITNVAVAPEYRRKKVGAGLMEHLIEEAKKRGATRMTLEVRPSNASAIALYERFGFKDYGRRPHYYLDNGEDAMIMWNMNL